MKAEDATLTDAGAALRDHFMGWQCRIRQHAMRREEGRPSEGMRPAVLRGDGTEMGRIIVVICEAEPGATTAQLRHIVRRTQDPRERFAKGVEFLSSAYFQQPRTFADLLLAQFGPQSDMGDALVADGRAVLAFSQFSQSYRLPCLVRLLPEDSPFAQALYWHNSLFNPAMPPGMRPIGLKPQWDEATAFPPVGK